MDAELNRFLNEEYGPAIKARNAAAADQMYDALYHAKEALNEPAPNLDYLRLIVARAIPK